MIMNFSNKSCTTLLSNVILKVKLKGVYQKSEITDTNIQLAMIVFVKNILREVSTPNEQNKKLFEIKLTSANISHQ